MTPAGELDKRGHHHRNAGRRRPDRRLPGGTLPLPLAHVLSALVPICADIARHRLYGEQAPEQIAKRNEAALAFLKSVGARGAGAGPSWLTASRWKARTWPSCSPMVGCLAGGSGASMNGPTSSLNSTTWRRGAAARTAAAPEKPKGLKEVFVATDLGAVANLGQHIRPFHVIYQEGTREQRPPKAGGKSAFDQVWLLVLVHRATPNQVSAGVWLGRMLQAVAGRACGDSTFQRETAPVKPDRVTKGWWHICPLPSRRQEIQRENGHERNTAPGRGSISRPFTNNVSNASVDWPGGRQQPGKSNRTAIRSASRASARATGPGAGDLFRAQARHG